ncbi:MAG: 50S ribosomal protein L17 [Patescibacteria group bacterium]|nr:50S ribosomal protein L17 [Patescibacteria group bacterium]
MRHRRKRADFNRENDHRKLMIRNLVTSLLLHGKIETTARRASVLAQHVEPMIQKALTKDKMNAIRYVNARVFSKEASIRLFDEIVPKLQGKNGGYTRTVKLGNRAGDNASKVLIEFAY